MNSNTVRVLLKCDRGVNQAGPGRARLGRTFQTGLARPAKCSKFKTRIIFESREINYPGRAGPGRTFAYLGSIRDETHQLKA